GATVDDLEGAGADCHRTCERTAAHLVDADDVAAPGPAPGGQCEFEVQGGGRSAHGFSGTSTKVSRPSFSRSQLLAGQKMTSARPVMSDSSTKPPSPWVSCQAESAEA